MIDEREIKKDTLIQCDIPREITLFHNGSISIRKPAKYADVVSQKLTLNESKELLNDLKTLILLIETHIDIQEAEKN